MKRIMIVAGEASGDLHGGRLAASLRSLYPDLAICGLGGVEMAAAGVEILYDSSKLAVMGLTEVLGRFLDIRRAMLAVEQQMHQQPLDLLILIDYPGFNLVLAERARRLHIPVLYYISPKVWAWRAGRVKKIKRCVDRMAVILPFEPDFYQGHGMKVDFVGNPLLDSVKACVSRADFRARHDIGPENTVVGILPGSRKQEIVRLLPVFLKAASLLAVSHQGLVFVLPQAPGLTRSDLERSGLADSGLPVRVFTEGRYDLMAACDAAMAASGTVTLELAILGVPMVVAYRLSPITYFLGRQLIKVKYASLVNLVAGDEVVPELLQAEATPEKICSRLRPLLSDRQARELMRQQLQQVCDRLGAPGATLRTAQLALEMIR